MISVRTLASSSSTSHRLLAPRDAILSTSSDRAPSNGQVEVHLIGLRTRAGAGWKNMAKPSGPAAVRNAEAEGQPRGTGPLKLGSLCQAPVPVASASIG